jgi:hypothetical protein
VGDGTRQDARSGTWGRIFLLAGLGLGTAVAMACLPDLGPLAASADAAGGAESGRIPTALSLCGDDVVATLDDGGDAGETCDPGEAGAPFPGCMACQVTCDGVIDPASDHCYFDAGTATSYDEAFRACADVGAHVATFASAREIALLGRGRHWVGLAHGPNSRRGVYLPARADEPGWPCPGCFPSREAGIFEPLPQADDCVASVDGAWFAVGCDDGGVPLAALCEREPLGRRGQSCGGAICFTLPATAGTKTYVLDLTGATPAAAARTCANYPSGSLVRLDSEEEREQLGREVDKFLVAAPPLASTFWIGLASTGGQWRWVDGEPVEARPAIWGEGQPVSSGVHAFLRMREGDVDTHLAFADERPDGVRPYVCQRAP